MKSFFFILFAIIVGAGGGYFAWKYFVNKSDNGSVFTKKKGVVTAKNYKEPFMWGVNVNPSSVGNYNLEMFETQMGLVGQLGAPWIRLAVDNGAPNKFEIFDEMVNSANSHNINVYMGLGSTKPILTIDDTYRDGFNVASEIASHYKGKIRYYQLMSEQGSTAIKGPQFSGEKESDYDQAKYEKVREWMKGASQAIRQADPDAYLVITDQWTHTAYFDMLLRDKVDFDIIGWNWFGDMGFMGDHKLTDKTLLVDKLKSFDKPILLAEVNYRPGRNGMDEDKQSDFIQQMADWANKSGFIKGFFVHELVDLPPRGGNKADYYGLIYYKKTGSTYTFGKAKKAFLTYKEIIAKYSK